MSIYVDNLEQLPKYVLKARSRKAKDGFCCHMTTDGPDEELHAFARLIGVDRNWFVEGSAFKHYDLVPLKRGQAVQEGAIEVSREMMRDIMRISQDTARPAADA